MTKNKKKALYIGVWAVVLIFIIVVSLLNFGYEDDKDYIVAIMTIALPFGVMLLDMFNYMRYENYPSAGKFIFSNFLLVFFAAFVLECAVVIFGFGLKNPQYKLFYTFALGGAALAAFLNLFQTIFFTVAAKGGKSESKKNKNKK